MCPFGTTESHIVMFDFADNPVARFAFRFLWHRDDNDGNHFIKNNANDDDQRIVISRVMSCRAMCDFT